MCGVIYNVKLHLRSSGEKDGEPEGGLCVQQDSVWPSQIASP